MGRDAQTRGGKDGEQKPGAQHRKTLGLIDPQRLRERYLLTGLDGHGEAFAARASLKCARLKWPAAMAPMIDISPARQSAATTSARAPALPSPCSPIMR